MKTIFMMIYLMQNLNWTAYKISVSKISLYFIKIFSHVAISCNSSWRCFGAVQCCHGNTCWGPKNVSEIPIA